jgi:F-type H+-transporting ATPase subunit delta
MPTTLIMMVVLQVVIFGVMVFFLKKILLRDTLTAVDKIRQVESDVARKEEGMRKQIEDHEKEFSRQKAELKDELEKERAVSEAGLGQLKDTITAEAQKEAARILTDAKRKEEKMREEIERQMEAKAIDRAGEVFRLTFSEAVTESVNREFVGELISALREVDAESIHIEGDEAHFVSSHAIDSAQREELKQVVSEKFNINVEINEDVDTSLLGGLMMKIGTLEIDGSLRNRFTEACKQLAEA